MSELRVNTWQRAGVAIVSALLLVTSIVGLASAKAAPAGTVLIASMNPVTLAAGVDVTLTSRTTAGGLAASQIDQGRVTFQVAVDGEGSPVPAARVVSWLALNAPGVRPQGGVTSLAVDLDALGFSAGTVGGFRAQFVPGAKGGKPATHRSAAVDIAAVQDVADVARVQIEPATVLLTTLSDSRQLRAVAYDIDGNIVAAPIRWSSSRPATVAVDAGGRVAAVALGSAQVVAEAGGVTSLPALVVVASPSPGAILVDDAQVVGGPVATVPGSDPSLGNTYDVLLRGVSVVPGDLIVGTGEKPVGGRVVSVAVRADGTSLVTLALVPLADLLPGLQIDETFDLETAEISIPDEITALYDVVRTGDTFDFTPKPALTSMTMVGGGMGGFLGAPIARPVPLMGGMPEFDGPGSTEFDLGPFECEAEATTVPLQLTEVPALSVTLSPSLDVLTTDGELERFVLVARPSATFKGNVAFTSAFEGKVECTKELFALKIPVGGLLSLAIGGLVPVGVGFEIGGKVTVANLTLGAEATMGADVEAGIVCPPGATCGFHKSIGNFRQEFKPNIQLPSLGQVRLEPSFTPFAFMKLAVGSPILDELRVEAIEAKVGFQLAGSFAPREVQILDPGYASDYKLTFEVSAEAEPDLGEVASALGITELAAASLSESFELARSATGSVIANASSFAPDETAHVRVRLNAATLTFLGLDNVDEVLLVRYAAGIETVVARQTASSGQVDFELSFVATGLTNASELFAFVEPKVVPELLALEIGRATPIEVAISPSSTTVLFGASQQFTATVTGTSNSAVAWTASCGTISASGLYTAPASGDECEVTATSQDFAHAVGTAAVELTEIVVAVSPTSAVLAPSATQQFTATVTGTEDQAVTWSVSCGSITSIGLFTAPASGGPCAVTATSAVDPSASGTSSVTISNAPTRVSIELIEAAFTGFASGSVDVPVFEDLPQVDLDRSGCPTHNRWLSLRGTDGQGHTETCAVTSSVGSASANATTDFGVTSDGGGVTSITGTVSTSGTASWSDSRYLGHIGSYVAPVMTFMLVAEQPVSYVFTATITGTAGSTACSYFSGHVTLNVGGQTHAVAIDPDIGGSGTLTLSGVASGPFSFGSSVLAQAFGGSSNEISPFPCGSDSASAQATFTMTLVSPE